VFYDSRTGAWERLRIEAGADIEQLLGPRTVLELSSCASTRPAASLR
jgi:hypothetical protein